MYSSWANRFVLSLSPSFTAVFPPRSSPNISSPLGNHLQTARCIASMVMSASGFAAASAQRRIGMTPAARWKASSRSIGGIDAAIGPYAFTLCIVSWYFPTRSMNAARTCDPVFIDRISSTMSCGFVSVTGDQSALVSRWIIW